MLSYRKHLTRFILFYTLAFSSLSYCDNWEQWRGVDRHGISVEANLLEQWPKTGPQKSWESQKIGKGYSSPIVVDDTIYVTGNVDKQLFIFALDLNGAIKWKAPNGNAWTRAYPGSRASCNYSNGKIYNVNAFGRLVCLNAQNGKELWSANLLETYKSRGGIWGVIDMIVVGNNAVYVATNGTKALMIALNKDTGAELWKTPNTIDNDYTYCPPILATINDVKQVISCGSKNTYGVDIKTGKLLWSFPHIYKGRMLATMPTFADGSLFVTNASPSKATTYRLDFTPNGIEKRWEAKMGNSTSGGIVIHNGVIYGAQQKKGFVCIGAEDGSVIYSRKELRNPSVIFADNRIYCQDSTGTLFLLEHNLDMFKTKGQLSIGKVKDFWAHPVIANGKLYLRHNQTLYCYNIRE